MKNSDLSHKRIFLTAREVMNELRLPKSTLYYLTKTGKIKAVRIGSRLRYRREEIERFLFGMMPDDCRGTARRAPTPFTERRAHPRINTHLPCDFSVAIADRKNLQAQGIIFNISEGGIYLSEVVFTHNGGKVEVDDPVVVHCNSFGSMEGRVIRINGRRSSDTENGTFAIAVSFRHLNEEVKEKIREFIG